MCARVFSPFLVGTRFAVVPEGCTPRPDRITLVLGAGRAFGSGEHETTRSCLEELEKAPVEGAVVLDLGCGTGIVAIAAAELGARRVIAVDPDGDAIKATRRNIALNGVAERVECIHGELSDLGPTAVDILVANLYADILLQMPNRLTAYLSAGGLLILSGIALDYHFDVRKAYERIGLRLVRRAFLDEYCTYVLRSEAEESAGL